MQLIHYRVIYMLSIVAYACYRIRIANDSLGLSREVIRVIGLWPEEIRPDEILILVLWDRLQTIRACRSNGVKSNDPSTPAR